MFVFTSLNSVFYLVLSLVLRVYFKLLEAKIWLMFVANITAAFW